MEKLANYLYYREMIGNIIYLVFLGIIFVIMLIWQYLYDRKEKKKNDKINNNYKR